jgi:glycosyltransferase involved in cell wall biosynthesis
MKKKLLVISSTFPRWKNDSVPPFVYELSRRFTEEFEVTIIAPHYPGAKEHEIMDGMHVYRFRYFPEQFEKLACSGGILPVLKKNKLYYLLVPFFLLAARQALEKRILADKPDLIHAHWALPQGFLAALAKRKHDIPYVVTAHGADIFALRSLTALKKFALKNADGITTASRRIKEHIGKIGIDAHIIPMGVDTKLFHSGKKDAAIREKHNITGPFLLFVGRLADKKGASYLIQAMPYVLEKHSTAKLLIVGSGPDEDKLKQQVNDLRLGQHITFAGPIAHTALPAYYATADIFVAPSIITPDGDREGTPVTILEALASGTRVVASGLDRTESSILYAEERNPEDLANKILTALASPKKKSSIMKYDWSTIAAKYKQVLLNAHRFSNKKM